MKEALKNAVDGLPEKLSQDAASMMRRMLVAMHADIAQDRQLANASYCSLLLRLSEPDLVREFDLAIKDAMKSIKAGSSRMDVLSGGLSLSMTPIDGQQTKPHDDFGASAALFRKICAKAGDYGIEGLAAFNQDLFLAAVKDAFRKSRIDNTEAASLLPYAQRALNAELVGLYAKLDTL